MSDQEKLMVLSRRGPARNAHADSARPARGHRSTWRDPRLTGGLVLIGASVALGSWAVNAAADTQQVYVLSRDVAPGQGVVGGHELGVPAAAEPPEDVNLHEIQCTRRVFFEAG